MKWINFIKLSKIDYLIKRNLVNIIDMKKKIIKLQNFYLIFFFEIIFKASFSIVSALFKFFTDK